MNQQGHRTPLSASRWTMSQHGSRISVNVLPMDLPTEDASFANSIRVKTERRALLSGLRKPPPGDDVTMVSAYQETDMLRSEKLLHEAAKYNKVDATTKLISRGINVNCTNNLDRTPIQWAAAHGSKDVIKVLLHHNANIESEDKYGMRPTLWAAWFGRVEVLRFLLACGAKPDIYSRQGLNILHCAASQNRVEVIDFILQYLEHFNLNATDRQNRTALHIAAREGHSEAVEKLLSAMKREKLNLKDKYGQTPFLCACAAGDSKCVEVLLENSCDINQMDNTGKTGLHLAAENGHAEVCAIILKFPEVMQSLHDDEKTKNNSKKEPFRLRDAPYDKKNEQTAIHLAVNAGNCETVRVLAQNGCNVQVKNSQGETPLHLAAKVGNRETIAELIRNGASVNQANVRLQTPLHVAVESGNIESVKELLDKGANARAEEKTGRTPLYMATRGSFTNIVDLIIRADMRQVNRSHESAGNSPSRRGDQTENRTKQNGDLQHGENLADEKSSHPGDYDIVDTELAEDETNNNRILDGFEHPHAELIKPILHKLAHKQLSGSEWKQLAKLLNFSLEHIKAIEHHYDGKTSSRNHGYRMLLIWLHGQGPTSNPTVQLYQGLVQIGKKNLADDIKRRIMLACGEDDEKKRRCLIC